MQGFDPDHKLTCDRCGVRKPQGRFAIAYPYRKPNGTTYWVKLSSRCAACRRTVSRRQAQDRRSVAFYAARMAGAYNRGSDTTAFQWASHWCSLEGGIERVAARCWKFINDPGVSRSAVGQALCILLKTVIELYERADELKTRKEEIRDPYMDLLTKKQLQDIRLRGAKAELRAHGYTVRRRRVGSPVSRPVSERDSQLCLKGVPLVSSTIDSRDVRAHGAGLAMDAVLQKLRELYVEAVERQGGRDVRYNVGMTIEENREGLEYLSQLE